MTTEEWLKDQCNRYGSTGECSSTSCLKRGGYVSGTRVDYSKATCHANEALKEIELSNWKAGAIKDLAVATIGGTVEGHPTDSINYLQRLLHLTAIEDAAKKLYAELSENCGATADWPLDLAARDSKSANRVAVLLTRLGTVLKNDCHAPIADYERIDVG